MTITISTIESDYMFSADIPESATIYEVMESISNLLLSTGFNYLNIVNAHLIEAERMQEAIKDDKITNQ